MQVELAIIGDAGVGKTSLIHAFKGEKDSYQTTSILDFTQVKYKNCQMNIYDMAGDQRFHSLVRDFILKADSVIIAFDLSDQQPLQKLNYFYQLVKDKHILFVGCKCDIQIINDETIKQSIQSITTLEKFFYFKTSVWKNINIQELLEEWYTQTQVYFKNKDIFALDDDDTNKPCCYCCNLF